MTMDITVRYKLSVGPYQSKLSNDFKLDLSQFLGL